MSGHCRKNYVGYKISCKYCKAVYVGETGENMHTQFKSHLSKYNSRVKATRESSAFVKKNKNFVTPTEGYKKEN